MRAAWRERKGNRGRAAYRSARAAGAVVRTCAGFPALNSGWERSSAGSRLRTTVSGRLCCPPPRHARRPSAPSPISSWVRRGSALTLAPLVTMTAALARAAESTNVSCGLRGASAALGRITAWRAGAVRQSTARVVEATAGVPHQ